MRAFYAGIHHCHDRVGAPRGNVPRRRGVDLLWSPLFGRKEWIVRCEEWLVDVIWLGIPHARNPLKLSDSIDDGGGGWKTDGDGGQLPDFAPSRPVDGTCDVRQHVDSMALSFIDVRLVPFSCLQRGG